VFAKCAGDITPFLQDLRDNPKAQAMFIHRLMFAVRYSQFHQLRLERNFEDAASDLVSLFHDDIAPRSWWAILLCDSVELLQHGRLSEARKNFDLIDGT
jgi:nuclear pore complex protein Nup85